MLMSSPASKVLDLRGDTYGIQALVECNGAGSIALRAIALGKRRLEHYLSTS